MKHSKHPVSARVEEDIHRRLEIVSLVDRRSVADIVAECVRRALPVLEAELQQPRLTPQMAADLKAGRPISEVLPSPYGHTVKPQTQAHNEIAESQPKPKRRAA